MTTSVRRHTAMVALALSLLGGGAALAANTALLSPTADGGLPGPIIDPGLPGKPLPGIPRTTIPVDLTK